MTTSDRTYYAELDVREDATPSRIRAAFRKLAKRYHPDRNPGSDGAEATFKRVNAAYLVLSDAAKREAYDQCLKDARAVAQADGPDAGSGEHAREGRAAAVVGSSVQAGSAAERQTSDGGSGELWLWLIAIGLPFAVGIFIRWRWPAVVVGILALAFAVYKRLWARRVPLWTKIAFFGIAALCTVRGAFGGADRFDADVPSQTPSPSRLQAKIADWRERISKAHQAADRGHLEQAQKDVTALQLEVAVEQSKVFADYSEVERVADSLASFQRALESASLVQTRIAEGRAFARNKSWLAADFDYQRAITSLQELESSRFSGDMPKAFAEQVRGELAGLEGAIASQVAEAKESAYRDLCGPRPERKDGEVVGLNAEIQRRAHDPKSIEVFGCTTPDLSADSCWLFKCSVRGKNTLGARVLQARSYQKSSLGFHDETASATSSATTEIEGPASPNDRTVVHVTRGCCAPDPDLIADDPNPLGER